MSDAMTVFQMGRAAKTHKSSSANNTFARAGKERQTKTQAGSFFDMAAQASGEKTNALATGRNHSAGTGNTPMAEAFSVPAGRIMASAVRSAEVMQTNGAKAVAAPSLEAMLKEKYPDIHYHVFDASNGNWKTRNDYPHYLLYQDGDKARETLEHWKPTGANPFYGSIDGRFIAPKEIHALGSVPPGSKAVVIHPSVQERMEQDPAYAQEIMAKIDTWFAFDAARNEAVMPGSTLGMSQAVAIGEDGNICNACASNGGGGITFSKSGSDNEPSWWELRMARHVEFMKLAAEQQIQRRIQASGLVASAVAKSRLAEMMNYGNLQEIFGSEIAGVSTETILAMTQAQVWGSSSF